MMVCNMEHKGKKALITGGTRGIGRAIALRLAQEGCELVLNYLDNEEAANEASKEIEASKGKVSLVRANLADSDQVKTLAEDALKILGSVDYLIHCAALGTFKSLTKLRSNQWNLTMDINVKSLLLLTQKLAPKMPKGSSIIAMSSSGSTKVVPNYGAIGVSKAALESMVRYLAVDLIPSGIRVNAVSAGPVATKSLDAFPAFEKMQQELIQRTPAKRLGKPDDLAGLVSFLCSKDAGWIVGQTILADGGLSLV